MEFADLLHAADRAAFVGYLQKLEGRLRSQNRVEFHDELQSVMPFAAPVFSSPFWSNSTQRQAALRIVSASGTHRRG